MTSGEKEQAVVAMAILERHPELGEGLDQFPVSESCNHIISQWLIDQGVADEDGCLSIYQQRGLGWSEGETILALSFGPVWMVLEGPVRRAEAVAPGLGWTVLTLLEKLDGTLSIVTPRYAQWMGTYCLWYGLDTDDDFRKEWEAMHEDPTEDDWEGYYKPSDFSSSFNDPRVLSEAGRPCLLTEDLKRLSAEHADPWVRELAAILHEIANLGEHLGTDVRQPEEGDSSPYPMEPMAVARWSEDDGMAHVIDQWVDDERAAGEAPPFEFLWSIDTLESAVDAIDHFESGFMRLRPFMKLARFLEKQS